MEKPILTLPAAEADLLRAEYGKAMCILEYGSGGSTVMASELAGKTIFSVESDMDWYNKMLAWFAENPGRSPVTLYHSDIGPTREWGYPVTDRFWKNFINYPFGIWAAYPALDPDVILIDGRFRVGCFFASLMNIRRDCTILFDDYTDREPYWVVEKTLRPSNVVGRMTRFEVSPGITIPYSFAELASLCLEAQ